MKQTLKLAERLGEALLSKDYRVATAESCTGGGIAQTITAIPGCSLWFEYGFVTYANRAKIQLLGVDTECLECHGAVSEQTVTQMARGALSVAGADLAVAVSGVAGPAGGTAETPIGTVWFAWVDRGGRIETLRQRYRGDRSTVREQSIHKALEGLLDLAIE